MSAFVIDTKTMDRCVRVLCAQGRYGMIVRRFNGIDTQGAGALTEIGQALFAMNIDAVCERYPDCIGEPNNMPGCRRTQSTCMRTATRIYWCRPALACGSRKIAGWKLFIIDGV